MTPRSRHHFCHKDEIRPRFERSRAAGHEDDGGKLTGPKVGPICLN